MDITQDTWQYPSANQTCARINFTSVDFYITE